MTKKPITKILISATAIFFLVFPQPIFAAEEQPLVHLLIRDKGSSILEIDEKLPEAGVIFINDDSGMLHEVNARSVLGLLYHIDTTTDAFEISEIVYYLSFDALYLKCITFNKVEKCDNWLYKIDGKMPSVGMENFILSGDENIEVFFDPFFWGSGEEESKSEPSTETVEKTAEESTSNPDKGKVVRSGGSRRISPDKNLTLELEPETERVEPQAIPVMEVQAPTLVQAVNSISESEEQELPKSKDLKVAPESVSSELPLLAAVEESSQNLPVKTVVIFTLILTVALYLIRRPSLPSSK